MRSMSAARSSTDFAIPPGLSKVGDIRSAPSDGIDWGVHFRAKSDDRLAGTLIEPSASVPRESGLYPAATPTAEPVEDPPGLCARSVTFLSCSSRKTYGWTHRFLS